MRVKRKARAHESVRGKWRTMQEAVSREAVGTSQESHEDQKNSEARPDEPYAGIVFDRPHNCSKHTLLRRYEFPLTSYPALQKSQSQKKARALRRTCVDDDIERRTSFLERR